MCQQAHLSLPAAATSNTLCPGHMYTERLSHPSALSSSVELLPVNIDNVYPVQLFDSTQQI